MDRPLLKLARNRTLEHPARLDRFNADDWSRHYETVRNGSTLEWGFFNGAVWLNRNFNRVELTRRQFTFNGERELTYDAIIRAHIGAANYAFYTMAAEQMAAMEKSPDASLEEHLSFRSMLTNSESGLEPNKLNMQRLDALCGPIWDLYQHRQAIRGFFPADRPHTLKALDFFAYENDMAQMSFGLKKIWQDLLYGGMEFRWDDKGVILSSSAQGDLVKAVSDYRREHHNGYNNLRIVHDLKQHRGMVERMLVGRRYLCCSQDHVLSLGGWNDLGENVRNAALYAWVAPGYMIDESLRSLYDAMYRGVDSDEICVHLLLVWFHLCVLAAQVKEHHGEAAAPRDWDGLLKLCPRFAMDELVARLVDCTGLSREQVAAAVELLTYQAKSLQHDLWSRPLVKVDDDVLMPIAAPLTASISRNFDIWFNETDPDAKKRGKLFERYLLDVLEDCRTSNALMRELKWQGSLEFPSPSGVIEEIDLAFSFGNVLVIAELRSRRTPITPLDYHNDLSDKNGVLKKSAQALRKTRHVKAGLGDFCRQYFPHLAVLPEVNVMPLVIISGQYHAGFPCDGVPVVDVHLLKHFLKDAQLRFGGRVEVEDRHQYGCVLYSCIEEAQRGFADYAANPGLIRILRSLAKAELRKYQMPGDDPEFIRSLFYTLSDVTFEQQLAAANEISGGKLVKLFD